MTSPPKGRRRNSFESDEGESSHLTGKERLAYSPSKKVTLGMKNAQLMQEAKRRASHQMAQTDEKVRRSLMKRPSVGTFGKT